MEDLNSVIIIGRLTKDAELTYTNSGYPLCKFSIASNRSKKDGDKYVDEASFFNVNLWGKRGEALNQYLLKGQQVAIGGSLKQDRWEKEGQKQSRVVIEAKNLQLIGSKKEGQPGGQIQGQDKDLSRFDNYSAPSKANESFKSDIIPF